jgi:hypothetical protein
MIDSLCTYRAMTDPRVRGHDSHRLRHLIPAWRIRSIEYRPLLSQEAVSEARAIAQNGSRDRDRDPVKSDGKIRRISLHAGKFSWTGMAERKGFEPSIRF